MTLKTTAQIQKDLLSRIQIRNKQRRFKIDRPAAVIFCVKVLQSMDRSDSALSVAFVSGAEIRRINNKYLQKDHATDVLSFGYDDETVDGRNLLGDIVISPEVSARNAAEFHVHPDKEVKKLLIHGILHLLGYDHETDNGYMQRMQNRLIRRNFFRMASPILKD